jgi:hypothetical protein
MIMLPLHQAAVFILVDFPDSYRETLFFTFTV